LQNGDNRQVGTKPQIPKVSDLIDQLWSVPDLPALQGTGVGVDQHSSEGQGEVDEFAFVHLPPGRWRLERPGGLLRAIGDSRREVHRDVDGRMRRCGVGLGWTAEPAAWLLRLPLTGIVREELQAVPVVESPVADRVVGRWCWRATLQGRTKGPLRLWFDAELPLLLRLGGGALTAREASLFAEITALHVGATGLERSVRHPLLVQPVETTVTPLPPGAAAVLREVRVAIPDAQNVELVGWGSDGSFQARFMQPTPRGAADVLVDRRGLDAAPYERMRAAMVRTSNARWCLSIDHDPELDHSYVRALAKRLMSSPLVTMPAE
jgi:hypothetical protein